MKQIVYLSLGTNLGNRHENLQQALTLLRDWIDIGRLSPIYETAPWGVTKQPPFLNMCLEGTTTHQPHALLNGLKTIEQQLGREEAAKWHARLIDIDILFYDDLILTSDTLTIPHPYIPVRTFVLEPLHAIAPQLVHPSTQQTITEMLTLIQKTEQTKTNASFQWGQRTYIMGIVNATPDSFSGDGILQTTSLIENAIAQTRDFIEAGVDIIDIGGESTRPNGNPVTAQMEQDRVLPVIEVLRREFAIPLSIDTYRASTARLSLAAGANWVNDIWGLKHDPEMATVVANTDSHVVIMHNGRNRERQQKDDQAGGYYGYFHYDDLLAEIIQELQESITLALNAGVHKERILIDPGIGFGKTGAQNIALINQLGALKILDCPILLGTSRKGFIGHTLGGLPAQERIEGTAATVAIGIDRGADMIRVHDVREMVRVARMSDALVRV